MILVVVMNNMMNVFLAAGIMGAVLGKFIKIGTHMIVKSAQETSEDLAAVK